MADGYINISIPKELIKKVDNLIEKGEYGYTSRAEFIKEAIREKLKSLGKLV